MTVPLVISLIGYSVLYGINADEQKGVMYMAIFFCTIGVSEPQLKSYPEIDSYS